MEEGKTATNSGIVLDWDTLLREEEAPPQLVVVVKNPTKRKSSEVGTGDNEEEESTEEMFQEFSDYQLVEAIERQKNTSATMLKQLPDGGEKLCRRVRLQEAELQRRRSVKDNAKWENLPKSHDLNCLGAHDGNQKERPCQVNKVSKFVASFHKKMENPTENVFRNELSILNCSGSQKLISSGNHLSARKHKGSLSLRQTQSMSPGNLSLHDDKCILKDAENGRRSMVTLSSSSKDRVTTKCSDKMVLFWST